MINLNEFHSAGKFRETYIHPLDDNKLIKIEKLMDADTIIRGYTGMKRLRHTIMRRLKPGTFVSGHDRELMGLQLIRRKGLLELPFFSGYLGEIDTNKGRGLIVERITNYYDGNVRTVQDYLKKYGSIPEGELRDALNKYFHFLSKNNLWLVSGGPENIAIVRDDKGRLALKTFDIKLLIDKRLFSWFFPKTEIQKRIKRQKRVILEGQV